MSNLPKTTSVPVTSFSTCNFLKKAPEYIDPSGHYVFCMKFCGARILVERHLGVVLEVLLDGGWIKKIPKYVDKYNRKNCFINWRRYLTFCTLEKEEKRNIEINMHPIDPHDLVSGFKNWFYFWAEMITSA